MTSSMHVPEQAVKAAEEEFRRTRRFTTRISDRVYAALAAAAPHMPAAGASHNELVELLHDLRFRLESVGSNINNDINFVERIITKVDALDALKSQPAPQHPDDIAVDSFASQMKAKLAQKRADGRTDLLKRYTHNLSILVHEHVAKGDPIDVAIICMMLAMNGQRIAAPQTGGGHEKI